MRTVSVLALLAASLLSMPVDAQAPKKAKVSTSGAALPGGGGGAAHPDLGPALRGGRGLHVLGHSGLGGNSPGAVQDAASDGLDLVRDLQNQAVLTGKALARQHDVPFGTRRGRGAVGGHPPQRLAPEWPVTTACPQKRTHPGLAGGSSGGCLRASPVSGT